MPEAHPPAAPLAALYTVDLTSGLATLVQTSAVAPVADHLTTSDDAETHEADR